jgi:hypothetical protein
MRLFPEQAQLVCGPLGHADRLAFLFLFIPVLSKCLSALASVQTLEDGATAG